MPVFGQAGGGVIPVLGLSRTRRKTRVVQVGKIGIGGDYPIRIQSMTNTNTRDIEATLAQCLRMAQAGCEIIRITTPTVEDARALEKIKSGLLRQGVDVPLVADIHFNPQVALEAAEFADKIRINPGNFADTRKPGNDLQNAKELEHIETALAPLLNKLKRLQRAMRIGVNHGSLSGRILHRYGNTPEGMVESALEYVRLCEKNGYRDIVLSIKAADPKVMIAANRLLALRMTQTGMDYPFHLGVTEAGGGEDGRIKSAIGIGSLLADGIGDTIRVSLTEAPEREIPVAKALAEPFSAQDIEESLPITAPYPDPKGLQRRASQSVHAGLLRLGGTQPVRVVTNYSTDTAFTRTDPPPEIIQWKTRSVSDLKKLSEIQSAQNRCKDRPAFLARIQGDAALALQAIPGADILWWENAPEAKKEDIRSFLTQSRKAGKTLLWSASDVTSLLALEKISRDASVPAILSVSGKEWKSLLYDYRLLSAELRKLGLTPPLHLRFPGQSPPERQILYASLMLGSLLCDGIGDSVQIDSEDDPAQILRLLYDILQGARSRVTKAEFTACPSCGRTLFDIESALRRIQSKTRHLKGVRIAVMGCIVNGPGEMADADFGYVGGAPGLVHLYAGKECVRKNIPEDQADQALMELIRSNGKWVDP